MGKWPSAYQDMPARGFLVAIRKETKAFKSKGASRQRVSALRGPRPSDRKQLGLHDNLPSKVVLWKPVQHLPLPEQTVVKGVERGWPRALLPLSLLRGKDVP